MQFEQRATIGSLKIFMPPFFFVLAESDKGQHCAFFMLMVQSALKSQQLLTTSADHWKTGPLAIFNGKATTIAPCQTVA